jgi:predicted transcriptional regulator
MTHDNLAIMDIAARITVITENQEETVRNFNVALQGVLAKTHFEKKELTKNPHNGERLICLECGKTFKTLRRHLKQVHKLTPECYRQRNNIIATDTLVHPKYSATRSRMAKENGLGGKEMKGGKS